MAEQDDPSVTAQMKETAGSSGVDVKGDDREQRQNDSSARDIDIEALKIVRIHSRTIWAESTDSRGHCGRP
jgi:hypothetical protein